MVIQVIPTELVMIIRVLLIVILNMCSTFEGCQYGSLIGGLYLFRTTTSCYKLVEVYAISVQLPNGSISTCIHLYLGRNYTRIVDSFIHYCVNCSCIYKCPMEVTFVIFFPMLHLFGRIVSIRYDTIRYDTIRYDTTRHDTIRYDTIRYDYLRFSTHVRHRVPLSRWPCSIPSIVLNNVSQCPG